MTTPWHYRVNISEKLLPLSQELFRHFIQEFSLFQKQSSRGVLQERCSLKFRKIHRKSPGLRPANLLKKRLWHRCFSVNIAKFLRTPFLTEHLRWLFCKIFLVIPGCNFCDVTCVNSDSVEHNRIF